MFTFNSNRSVPDEPTMPMFTLDGKYIGTILAVYPELWFYTRPDGVLAMISNVEIHDGQE